MAGHSKWSNIQHRKNAQDAKRGKLFTRLIREITTAARLGDPDPDTNPRLRLAVEKALGANMPKDNIDRAIKRGSGDLDGQQLQEIRYEGYAPSGVAVMVDCISDNRNRTVAEVRHAFSKYGGNLGAEGSVAYLFSQAGVLTYPPGTGEDVVMEAALEAGAEDIVSNDDDSIDVLTDPNEFHDVRSRLIDQGLTPAEAEITMRPSTTISLGVSEAESVIKLLDVLENLDDAQTVYSNADFPEQVFANA